MRLIELEMLKSFISLFITVVTSQQFLTLYFPLMVVGLVLFVVNLLRCLVMGSRMKR